MAGGSRLDFNGDVVAETAEGLQQVHAELQHAQYDQQRLWQLIVQQGQQLGAALADVSARLGRIEQQSVASAGREWEAASSAGEARSSSDHQETRTGRTGQDLAQGGVAALKAQLERAEQTAAAAEIRAVKAEAEARAAEGRAAAAEARAAAAAEALAEVQRVQEKQAECESLRAALEGVHIASRRPSRDSVVAAADTDAKSQTQQEDAADPTPGALLAAIRRRDEATVLQLLQQPQVGGLNDVDQNGETLLHLAISQQLVAAAGAIAAQPGFSGINTKDQWGSTALHLAAANGFLPVCQAILGRGDFTELLAVTRGGNSASQVARNRAHGAVEELLQEAEERLRSAQ